MPTTKKNNKLINPSKKIKKAPTKFEQLVQSKTKTNAKVIEERKTLLREYQALKKSNEVHDKRFLKKRDPTQKFAYSTERKNKKISIFNLDSDDEGEKEIKFTHKGVDIDLLDDFKDNEIEREGSEDENINAQLVNDFHFEGFDEDEEKDQSRFHEKKKTKQEIYRELIHKSKKEKFHRQQAQMEAEAKVDELDNEFQNIIGMLVKNYRPNQYKEKKMELSKNDPYLQLQSELQNEIRMKPQAENTLDPKRQDKKKKTRKKVRFVDNEDNDGAIKDEDEEEDDEGSDIGADEEVVGEKKKERKEKRMLKDERRSKKFMNFLDDIKALKGEGDEGEGDELDNVDLSEDEEDDEEGDGEEGMDGEEFDDDDLDDEDLDDLDDF